MLAWLENDMWLAIYTANGDDPTSTYNIITRQQSNFTFQKIPDPIAPFGAEKPPQHTLLRLRDWPPDLKDLLIVASTATPEIGLLSRATKSLSESGDSGPTNVFATTEIDDSRRPTLPMTESMDDSLAIGLAFDLSSKDKVYKPIPMDEELEESPDPVPGMWILTQEGILCSWWFIYEDSIKQGKPYPGLAVADASASSQISAAAPAAASTPFAAAKSSFGSSSAMPFGSTTPAAPSFGSSTQLGLKSSPWGAPSTSPHNNGSAFGSSSFGNSSTPSAPAFGKPSTPGFGQAPQLGAKSSPWGSGGASGAGSSGTSAPAFGQTGFSSFANQSSSSSLWGAAAETSAKPTEPSSSGGFAGFSQSGGFASVASNNASGSVFGSGAQTSQSSFGFNKKEDTAFPPKADGDKSSTSAFGSQPFKLGSLFQDNATPTKDESKPSGSAGASMFGSTFGSALDTTKEAAPSQQASQEVEMDADAPANQPSEPQSKPKSLFGTQDKAESTTPTSTPAAKFGSGLPSSTPDTPGTSLFGKPTPAPSSGGGIFGSASGAGSGGFFNKPKESSNLASQSGGLFSKPQESSSSTSTTGSLFGKPSEPNNSAPQPGSLFGKPKESSSAASQPGSLFGKPSEPNKSTSQPGSLFGKPKESSNLASAPAQGGLFGKPSEPSALASQPGSLFGKPKESSKLALEPETPKVKTEEPEAPLPPDTTSRLAYPLGDSSSSSAASNATAPSKASVAPPAPAIDPLATPKANKDAALRVSDTPQESYTPASPRDEARSRPLFGNTSKFAPPSDEETDSDEDASDESGTEGSGVDVAKDLSPDTNDKGSTSAFKSQAPSSFFGSKPTATQPPAGQQSAKPLFGGLGNKPALFPANADTSPRSPSPVRGAVPSRLSRAETRSVSAPGMASQLLSSRNGASRPAAATSSRREEEREETFVKQLMREKLQKEADERQLLIDNEDDQIQALLASEVVPTLTLDEFVAHTNSAPPAQESVPSQVEAVYRDVNSMIDTIGLNARAVKSFIKGHSEPQTSSPKAKSDLDDINDWVLCEVDALGRIVDREVRGDLEEGRVQDLDEKLKVCKELTKELHRLRAKREDLAKMLMVKTDPSQAQAIQSMALSAEQAAQQNELRKEFTRFSTLLGQAEEALTLLKAKIASTSKGSGRTAMPTVEAVMRTITKMTSVIERRSGDIDVLENQIRKMGLGSGSREGSPMVTPQARRSIMFSPDSTPSRNLRHSFATSMGSMGSPSRGTPPRKKLTTFTEEEKQELKGRRDRRQAVLAKLKDSVEKKGPVQVWSLEETE